MQELAGLAQLSSLKGEDAPVGSDKHRGPATPIVGYEREAGLVSAKGLGFQTIGELQVWIRTQNTRRRRAS